MIEQPAFGFFWWTCGNIFGTFFTTPPKSDTISKFFFTQYDFPSHLIYSLWEWLRRYQGHTTCGTFKGKINDHLCSPPFLPTHFHFHFKGNDRLLPNRHRFCLLSFSPSHSFFLLPTLLRKKRKGKRTTLFEEKFHPRGSRLFSPYLFTNFERDRRTPEGPKALTNETRGFFRTKRTQRAITYPSFCRRNIHILM